MKVKSLSRVRLSATPWITAYQVPPSMGLSRQEYWSGVPLPSPIYTVTQSLSCVQLCHPMNCKCQDYLSNTISLSFLKLISIESLIPPNHLILRCPLLLLPSIFSSIRVFSNQSPLYIRWPKYWNFSIRISPSRAYSGLTGLISLQCKGLSRIFSRTTVQKHQFFNAQPSLWPTLTSAYDHWKNHSFD